MYTVRKENGRMIVTDTTAEKVIYSAPEDAYIVSIKGGVAAGTPQVEKVGTLTEIQLLTALASAKKLLQ